jgi:ParB/RepB/Spo0J family partition protein
MNHERELKWIDTDKIINNDQNPRAEDEFKPEALEALRHSIKTHGLFQPVIVTEYRKNAYKLIEGERRWTSAKLEDIKQLPAVVVNRMDPKDEVITMFNIHTQFKGWQVAEELRAIQEIRDRNGHLTDEQVAKELGMNLATYRDRVRVLLMGAAVVRDIATDKIQFSAALRSDEVTKMLVKKRPKLVDKIGGAKEVKDQLLAKAKARKRGISQELVQFRHDLGDTERISDKAVEEYLREPGIGFREILYRHKDAEDAHKVDELSIKVTQLEREFRKFNPKALSVDNLRKLRRGISDLLEAGQELESKISDELGRAGKDGA